MNTEQNQTIPPGYREDSKRRLVPETTIAPIDLARDDLVLEIVAEAKRASSVISQFKAKAFGDIAAFIDMSMEQYGAQIGGELGNVTLTSINGRHKVQITMAANITFDERLQAAKALIDEFIMERSDGLDDCIKVLLFDAFQVDSEGKISIGKVLGLRRHKFDDPKWQMAMQAISDSIQVIGSKSYVRIYERLEPAGKWQPVVLDVAAV